MKIKLTPEQKAQKRAAKVMKRRNALRNGMRREVALLQEIIRGKDTPPQK